MTSTARGDRDGQGTLDGRTDVRSEDADILRRTDAPGNDSDRTVEERTPSNDDRRTGTP